VLRPIVLCVVFGGCNFPSRLAGGSPDAPVANDATDATALDGAIDGMTTEPTDCWTHWFDGNLTIAMPQVLPNQSDGNADERDPWISMDGLTLYYTVDPMGAGESEISLASRPQTSQAFGPGSGTHLISLNTTAGEQRAALTPDEKMVVLSSNRIEARFDIYLAERSSKSVDFPSPDARYLGNVNTPNVQHHDPFLSPDGKRLYLASDPDTAELQHIFLATRSDTTSPFGTAAELPVINNPTSGDADPALSLDERVIMFNSNRPTGIPGIGGTNLWYATRQDPMHDFGPPKLVPVVNSDRDDGDPMPSADGCELYFASKRNGNGNDYDLFSARIAK
jgi:hypothetical protein